MTEMRLGPEARGKANYRRLVEEIGKLIWSLELELLDDDQSGRGNTDSFGPGFDKGLQEAIRRLRLIYVNCVKTIDRGDG